jgi:pimeloyl-ACP methyl ester carboxylesterase
MATAPAKRPEANSRQAGRRVVGSSGGGGEAMMRRVLDAGRAMLGLRVIATPGGDEVLVLHGGPGVPPAKPWPLGDALTRRWRFIYVHQRGCGLSTRLVDRAPGGLSGVKAVHDALGLPAQIADIEPLARGRGREKRREEPRRGRSEESSSTTWIRRTNCSVAWRLACSGLARSPSLSQ